MFVAVTLNVYDVPFVNCVTVQLNPDVEHERPPGDAVTVYAMIGLFQSTTGGCHVTVACPFPAAAATVVGGPGTWVSSSAR